MNPKQEMYIKQGEDKKPSPPKKNPLQDKKSKKKIIWIAVILVIVIGGWIIYSKKSRQGKQIEVNNQNQNGKTPSSYPLANEGDVSPISGLACENWNRRPIAVMQAADVQARPASGFSKADMVIEMPVITASITRLMGIYICNDPEEVGSMRSSRHDFIHLAKGFDAIYVHWGGSHQAKDILNEGLIENINCNNDGGKSGGHCCFRKEGMSRGVDSGYAKFDKLLECSEDFGYRMTSEFSGYPHQGEAPTDDRPESGNLRVGFAGAYAVNYEYDKESNSYKRIWDDDPDKDRATGEQIAPKNVVVMIAKSEQIEGQYNNVQLGDPWYDESDSGEAHYYFNGKEMVGTWKKDKSSMGSKLLFMDSNGNDIKFVPGQIWVEILEPGQGLKWRTNQQTEEQSSSTEEKNNTEPDNTD